jgi:uncharacterized Zn finger protein
MSVRSVKCPECGHHHQDVIQDLTPDTDALNTTAVLRCLACGHEFQARVMSKRTREMRDRGYLRV